MKKRVCKYHFQIPFIGEDDFNAPLPTGPAFSFATSLSAISASVANGDSYSQIQTHTTAPAPSFSFKLPVSSSNAADDSGTRSFDDPEIDHVFHRLSLDIIMIPVSQS